VAWSSNPFEFLVACSSIPSEFSLRLLISQDILTLTHPFPGMFLRDAALASDAGGPVGATGQHGPPAAGAAGPLALALLAGWTAPWEWECNHVVQSPPTPLFSARLQTGGIRGRVRNG
jgi:hypothetical protein